MTDFDDLKSALEWHDGLGRFTRWALDLWHAPLWPFSVRGRTFFTVELTRPVSMFDETCALCDATGRITVARHNELMYPCNQIVNMPAHEKTQCFRCRGRGKLNWGCDDT